MAGAMIIVSNIENGAERSAETDASGNYSFPQLPPGAYFLLAQSAGFADVMIEGLEVRVNTNTTVPHRLRNSETVTETVTVNADTVQFEHDRRFGRQIVRHAADPPVAAQRAQPGRPALAAGGGHLSELRPPGCPARKRYPQWLRERSPEQPGRTLRSTASMSMTRTRSGRSRAFCATPWIRSRNSAW